MKIGEIARKTEISRDAIRLYERMGLLTEITRPHAANDYKEYAESNVKRILLIKSLKVFGFTLKECAEVIHLMNGDTIDEEVRSRLIHNKIEEIEAKIAELKKTKKLLHEVLNKSCNEDCT